MDELNKVITRNKLYTVIEFFYRYSKEDIEEHANKLRDVNLLTSRAYIFILQTLYILDENKRDDIPKEYAKLFNIENATILLYDKKNIGILEDLYNNINLMVKGEYKFMKLVEDKENYNKYKTICYPCMQIINEGRK